MSITVHPFSLTRLVLCTVVAFLFSGCSASLGPQFIGKQAPFARVTLLDGDLATLSQFHGKPLVIAFWATTCSQSPRQLDKFNKGAPALDALGVQTLAVSIDEQRDFERVKKLIASRNLTNVTHAFSGNGLYDETYMAFRGEEVPYFFVFDARGVVVAAGNRFSVVEDYFGL